MQSNCFKKNVMPSTSRDWTAKPAETPKEQAKQTEALKEQAKPAAAQISKPGKQRHQRKPKRQPTQTITSQGPKGTDKLAEAPMERHSHHWLPRKKG